MLDSIKNNPVRIYEIAVAVVALVLVFIPTFPAAAVLGVVAAVLGGEVVRSQVTPTSKLEPEDPWGF